jgi:hypothetical protein
VKRRGCGYSGGKGSSGSSRGQKKGKGKKKVVEVGEELESELSKLLLDCNHNFSPANYLT